jgi:hypothetical protein
MVAGAGYAVGSSKAKHKAQEQDQEERLSQLEAQQNLPAPPAGAPAPPAAAPAPPAGGTDRVAQLTQLKELLDSGVLTQEEFALEKARILAS